MSVKELEPFTAEQVERGARYHRPRYLVLVADLALGLAVLAAFAWWRPDLGLRWWLEAPAVVAVVLVVSSVVTLPLSWWSGYVHERRWELSTQTPRGWLADRVKGLAVSLVLGAAAATGLVALARWLPTWWPLVAAVAAAALVLLLGFLAPVVLEPLFNRFRPLDDEALRGALLELAEAAGAPVRDVLVADASRRTRKANAYVSGIGRTRRVVLYDTFLGAADAGAVRVVAAHELAHRRQRHVVKLTAVGMAGAAAGIGVVWALLGERAADPDWLPVVLLVLALLQLLATPALAWLSRRYEREADRIALELTRDPAAFERAFVTLADTNVADLDPPWPVRALLLTHPTLPERIRAGRAFGSVAG
ncbi:MAG TPA: M48 family metalloprotease [Gaiellaceae bacterium]|nr:M48 family metalloprotease [Gaiellaceae bacterium]